jgi:hypothetical protein
VYCECGCEVMWDVKEGRENVDAWRCQRFLSEAPSRTVVMTHTCADGPRQSGAQKLLQEPRRFACTGLAPPDFDRWSMVRRTRSGRNRTADSTFARLEYLLLRITSTARRMRVNLIGILPL